MTETESEVRFLVERWRTGAARRLLLQVGREDSREPGWRTGIPGGDGPERAGRRQGRSGV